jgi:hypothetical protein
MTGSIWLIGCVVLSAGAAAVECPTGAGYGGTTATLSLISPLGEVSRSTRSAISPKQRMFVEPADEQCRGMLDSARYLPEMTGTAPIHRNTGSAPLRNARKKPRLVPRVYSQWPAIGRTRRDWFPFRIVAPAGTRCRARRQAMTGSCLRLSGTL